MPLVLEVHEELERPDPGGSIEGYGFRVARALPTEGAATGSTHRRRHRPINPVPVSGWLIIAIPYVDTEPTLNFGDNASLPLLSVVASFNKVRKLPPFVGSRTSSKGR